jgi:acyl carrier protein
MSLREQLMNLLKDGDVDLKFDLEDDTPLISEGLVDSLLLFNLALWIEKQTNTPIDVGSIDLPDEWNTIADILAFIGKHRK